MRAGRFLLFFLVLFFVLSMSACSFNRNEEDDWQDEIIMAEECGEEGLQCCADKDPECKFGSCCVDPNDPTRNYCSETCEFGKEDTFCRANNECDEGLSCSESYCVPCGGQDQPCCADNSCSDSLACFRGTCVTCGLTDNPCCLTEPYCQDQGADNPNRAECKAEICSLCGANGHEPCQAEPACNENHLLNIGQCFRCGGFNQPCCHEIVANETKKYCVEPGLECKLDFCSK